MKSFAIVKEKKFFMNCQCRKNGGVHTSEWTKRNALGISRAYG
jgi:hypothetical protein